MKNNFSKPTAGMHTGAGLSQCRGKLLRRASLARYNSWRVGGTADKIFIPADLADLQCFLQTVSADEPLTWLGLGSNVLIRDGGVRGTVIITQHGLRNVNSIDETKIRAEAGLSCAKVARFSVRKALLGAEFLAGIPGTMGGALAMNAGAFGGETWNVVHAVEAINRFGDIVVRHANEYKASYRQVIMPCEDEWFVAGHLALVPGNSDDAMQRIRECIMWRNSSQPTNSPSCGSVFRNPPNSYAGYLIETAGLKGFTIGGAIVSDKHANFILNINRATARDIETLILHVIDTVERMHGIRLQTEVKFIGEEGMG